MKAAKDRIAQKDPWATNVFLDLQAKADQALALSIPENYVYDQKNSDTYGNPGAHLAIAYSLTGDTRYGEQARKILVGMARGFTADNPYIMRNFFLDFSVSMPSYVHIFELLHSALTPEEREQVAAALSTAAEKIKNNAYGGPDDPKAHTPLGKTQHGESHMRSFHNTAVYLIGAALNRADFKTWALDEPDGGFKAHVERGYDTDGMINEGSLHHQLYDLTPLLLMARAAQHNGDDLFDYQAPNGNSLKKFLEAPIAIARPDLTVNSTGDGQPDALALFTALYSLGNSHYKDPVFSYLIAMRQPAPDRAWTALTEALAVFTPPPGQSRPPLPGPTLYKSGLAMIRQHPSSDYYDLKKNSRWALLSAQNHSDAHQNANQLDLQLGIGDIPLSVNGNDDPSRGYNILTLDGQVPMRSCAKKTYCDSRLGQKAAIQICEGVMTGGYKEDGLEKTARLLLGIGTPEDPRGYFIDIARMQAGKDSAGRRIGWIWHGPVEAGSEKTDLAFAPVRVDAQNPALLFAKSLRLAKPTAQGFSLRWVSSDGKAGLATHLLGGRKTNVFLGRGPQEAPFLHAERVFPAPEAAATAFIAVHELYIGANSALRAANLLDNDRGAGVIVSGPNFRDWATAAYDGAKGLKAINPADLNEYFFIKGKFGYARISKDSLEILGDGAAEIQVKAPRIKKVLYNGNPVLRYDSDGGYVHATLKP
ncbi:MAG: hypothetical protein A3J74_00440 [Elusimicrobia bacterium RIFCSPHIGHO2_02_FULL_57_9]|nr:MAG: hypothetical protein A3J74_00440 [Elusimicrobia bacterium RIFCSPHIGHO2_02_FULL_57_9]